LDKKSDITTNKKQASLHKFFTKKVLPVKHSWVTSQSMAYSSVEVSQSSVVTGKELLSAPSSDVLDSSLELSQSSQELSQSSMHFNGTQGHRHPSEGFLDVSTPTTSPLLFCLGYDIELLQP
jgi:hypothetical protein